MFPSLQGSSLHTASRGSKEMEPSASELRKLNASGRAPSPTTITNTTSSAAKRRRRRKQQQQQQQQQKQKQQTEDTTTANTREEKEEEEQTTTTTTTTPARRGHKERFTHVHTSRGSSNATAISKEHLPQASRTNTHKQGTQRQRRERHGFEVANSVSVKPLREAADVNVSVWPARTSQYMHKHSPKDSHSPEKGTGESSTDAGAGTGSTPRITADKQYAVPGLLNKYERMIADEFAAQGLHAGDPPSEERLRVFQSVFETFITDFITYQPLLAAIKTEYELMLETFRRQAELLEPLQLRLTALQQETQQMFESMQKEHSDKVAPVVRQLQELHMENNALKEQTGALEAEILDLRSQLQLAQSNEDEQFELRMQLQNKLDAVRDSMGGHENEVMQLRSERNQAEEDLKYVQNDHAKVLMQVYELQQAVKDMVPKQMYEVAAFELKQTSKQLNDLKPEHMALLAQHNQLKTEHEIIQSELHKYKSEWEVLKRSGTPQPKWSEINQELPQLKLDIHHRTSIQLANDLKLKYQALQDELEDYKSSWVDEQRERAEAEAREGNSRFFDGLGTGNDVPLFLRATGKIRNRHMKKHELEALLKEIWKAKEASDASRSSRQKMSKFLFQFLKKRQSSTEEATEMAYNIMDALERFKWDADCELFLKVLSGDLPEMIYWEQSTMLDNLKKVFGKLDLQQNKGKQTGKVTKKAAFDAIEVYFASKTDGRMRQLRQALNYEQPGTVVRYRDLFAETKEGNQGPFVETVRDHYIEEREELQNELKEAIDKIKGDVSVKDMRKVFAHVDRYKPDDEVDMLLAGAYGCTVDALDDAQDLPGDELFVRLKEQPLGRSNKPGSKDPPPDGSGRFQVWNVARAAVSLMASSRSNSVSSSSSSSRAARAGRRRTSRR